MTEPAERAPWWIATGIGHDRGEPRLSKPSLKEGGRRLPSMCV